MSVIQGIYEIIMMYIIVRFVLNRTVSRYIPAVGIVLLLMGYYFIPDILYHPAVWLVVIMGGYAVSVINEKIINRAAISIVAYLILVNFDIFMASLEGIWENTDIHESMYSDNGNYILRLMVMGIVCILMCYIRKKNQRTIMPDNYVIWAGIKIIFYFVIMSVTDMVAVYNKRGLQYLVVISFALFAFVVDVFIIMFYYLLDIRDELKESSVAKDYYIDEVNAYYNKIIEDAKNVKRVRHDIKAHINAVKYYAKTGSTESIEIYADKLLDELEGKHTNIVVSGLTFLDAIIAKFIDTYSDIDFSVFGNIRDQKMPDYDISILMTNLLNNAVEACEKYDGEKYVEINLANRGGKCIIKIANPIDENFKGIQYTSKEDKGSHGYGLGQVKKIAERNGGRLDINIKKDGIYVDGTIRRSWS